MRTVFVNPSASFSNPRRRRRKSRPRRQRRVARRRRRNAGIVPFVANPRRRRRYNSNPLILENPRRRRRRRNPSMSMKSAAIDLLTHMGGSAVGAGTNILLLRKVENDWFRNGLRVAIATGCGIFMKGGFGSSTAGAIMYPAWAELALMTNLVGGANVNPVSADLSELSADLADTLDEMDEDDDDLSDDDDDDDEELFVP